MLAESASWEQPNVKKSRQVSSTCKLFSCDSSIYHFFVKCWYDKLFKSPLGFNLTFFIISMKTYILSLIHTVRNIQYFIDRWRLKYAELFAFSKNNCIMSTIFSNNFDLLKGRKIFGVCHDFNTRCETEYIFLALSRIMNDNHLETGLRGEVDRKCLPRDLSSSVISLLTAKLLEPQLSFIMSRFV